MTFVSYCLTCKSPVADEAGELADSGEFLSPCCGAPIGTTSAPGELADHLATGCRNCLRGYRLDRLAGGCDSLGDFSPACDRGELPCPRHRCYWWAESADEIYGAMWDEAHAHNDELRELEWSADGSVFLNTAPRAFSPSAAPYLPDSARGELAGETDPHGILFPHFRATASWTTPNDRGEISCAYEGEITGGRYELTQSPNGKVAVILPGDDYAQMFRDDLISALRAIDRAEHYRPVTIDGVRVVPGLRVWTYDLGRATVTSKSRAGDYGQEWVRWHVCQATDTPDGRGGTFDPKRLWRAHPTTRELA